MHKPELPRKKAENRALHTRRDTDVERNITVTLFDVDNAIMEYLSKLDLHVDHNDEKVQVPVLYGAEERWKAVKEGGVFRDSKGKVQTPLIMFKRNTIAKNDNMAMLNRYVHYAYTMKYTPKTRYDKYSIMNRVVPTRQVYNVIMPDYVTLSYECLIWTDFIEHMNAIIEKIKFAAEEYWGDPNRFRFRVTIDDFSNTSEVSADEDRVIRTEFSMVVYAYLLPKDFEYENTTQKLFTAERLVTVSEIDVTSDRIHPTEQSLVSLKKRTSEPTVYVPGTPYPTDPYDPTNEELYKFLGLNKSLATTHINDNERQIEGYKLETTIPTIIHNVGVTANDLWSVYINGVKVSNKNQHITLDNDAIGGACLIFDPTSLGYTVDNTDDVIVVGKFRSVS